MLNVIKNASSTLPYNTISKIQTSQHLSSGNRINVASDDASSLSPSVRVTFSPEAMALQSTTTQGTNSSLAVGSASAVISESDYASDSARSGLQIRNTLSTVMLDQENQGAQAVMQLLR